MPSPAPTLPGTIGEYIRKRREQLGMTAEDVAKIVGVHQTTVSRWERSRHLTQMAKKGRMGKLAAALEDDPDVLWDRYTDTLRDPHIPGWLTRMMVRGSHTSARTTLPPAPRAFPAPSVALA